MKASGVGVILIAAGIIFLYMVITDKLDCFKGAFKCAFLDDRSGSSKPASSTTTKPTSSTVSRLPSLPRLSDFGLGGRI